MVIAGDGRDRPRLEHLAATTGAPVHFLGRIPGDALPMLLGCADVFAMLCRNRWGGVEQEGLGIVFLEAAAAGVPQVAGASGGAAEAVVDGETGVVVQRPEDPAAVEAALAGLLDDPVRRAAVRRHGPRQRCVADFDHDRSAARLQAALDGLA